MKRSVLIQPTGIANLIKGDYRTLDIDAERLSGVQQQRPKVPPHVHVYDEGKCKRCGRDEAQR